MPDRHLSPLASAEKSSFFGGERRDYWHWIASLPKNNALHYELAHARNVLHAKTAQGRGRAFIRYALMGKSLADAVQLLIVDPALREYAPSAGLSARTIG